MPKSVAIVSSLCKLERTPILLHDTRLDAEACQDSNSVSLGAACQLVSGEVFVIRSSYGELVLRRSFACKYSYCRIVEPYCTMHLRKRLELMMFAGNRIGCRDCWQQVRLYLHVRSGIPDIHDASSWPLSCRD